MNSSDGNPGGLDPEDLGSAVPAYGGSPMIYNAVGMALPPDELPLFSVQDVVEYLSEMVGEMEPGLHPVKVRALQEFREKFEAKVRSKLRHEMDVFNRNRGRTTL